MARLTALSTYSMLLMRRFEASGDRAELAHAVRVARQVLAECGEADPDRGAYLSNLAVLLRMRYLAVSDHDALLEAIAALTEALRLMAADDRDRGALHANLAMTLRLSYERSGAVDTLEAAVGHARAGLTACDPRHPQRAAIQTTLAALLRALAERTHDAATCEEGLNHARSAVALDPGHRPALVAASALCRLRYGHTGDEADLDDAVAFARAAAEGVDHLDTSFVALHSELSTALFARYERFGDPADIDGAIDAARAAAAAGTPGRHHAGGAATNLAGMLRSRFDASGDLDDLTEAIEQGRAALATPADPPARVAALTNLASGLQTLFERTGDLGRLDEAIELRRAALDVATAPGQLTAVQSGLAAALRARHERSGALTDLDDAITAGTAAVRAAAHDPRAQARHLANLSAAYRTRFERVGDPDDAHRAVQTARQAVDQTPGDDQHLPRRRSTLALALLRSFTQEGDLRDVDEAITLGRAAVADTAPGHRLRPRLLGNIANALRARYERTRDLADLHEAIAVARQAVAATHDADARRPQRLANLSAALLRRFEVSRQRVDIDDAVDAATAAERGTPPDHPSRPLYLADLGLMLLRRYEAYNSPPDLETSVLASVAAITATPLDHPNRPGYLSNLVPALLAVGALTGDAGHLDEAVRLAREAAAAPPGSADPGGVQFNLGTALDSRHSLHGAEEDRLGAVEAFAACARHETTTPLVRAVAAVRQGRLGARTADWHAADSAYADAIALLPLISDRTGGWDSRQHQLAQLNGLGSDAAAVALHLGDPDRAVLLLEQARAILIGQSLDSRADVRQLHETHPDLAAAFERLRAVLNADTRPSSESDTDLHAMTDPAAWRRRAATEFRAVVAAIRGITQHRGFLRPPDIADVRGYAVAGPIVIVNVSQHRCDALLIRPDDIVVVPLPDLDHHEVEDRAAALLAATAANTWTTNDTVIDVLGWLWDAVAAPVLDALALPAAGTGPLPRLRWLPTGALSLLPLHAAGHYSTAGPARSMLDLAVSSYLVTLRGLDPSRTPAADPDGDPLVVGMASTPGLSPLPRAHDEARLVSNHLRDRTGPLLDAAATRGAVADRLDRARQAHFACHARTDIDDPSASALLLADGPLFVRDVIAGPAADRKLAFLSACTTAVTSARFLDEALHVVAAFHLAGFRCVIGSLWLVDDAVSYDVAQVVYAALDQEADPARALHSAVSVLRSRYPASPSLWAGYLHSGDASPS
ncbi:CHAT domain-containing protein [Dactylosporangium aurantiacum]|uniref:CHAT domain-containing protein n=1 Tax=Dactylosporangium aurantiacum TaxID=35754 RepID=A0A9Q9I6S3_9ACTN|nr:CHAT domain-containing protein [Dactylosporangium aurantiacum]MDG6106941.1 CHAT domain-containing protein [Dactylosporangium aurantiacum]UWZ50699.1 CHAT domain-containing protein [Dactylosporangium aurantiacum]